MSMNLIKTFEERMNTIFGSSTEGFTAPFSIKKLAKRAAREMEAETFEIDGINTAPARYTVLVSPTDDATMRSLYVKLISEISAFIEAKAQSKSYVFTGKPLIRFMVDPGRVHWALVAPRKNSSTAKLKWLIHHALDSETLIFLSKQHLSRP